jgi:hypothetical protein
VAWLLPGEHQESPNKARVSPPLAGETGKAGGGVGSTRSVLEIENVIVLDAVSHF